MNSSITPGVSVVMVVYNPHPTYFSQAVKSVLAQTFRDFEFVIIEDPSLNSAAEMLATLPDPRVRHYCSAQRTSQREQRTRAITEARADLVAVIDADDVWEPSKLEKQLAFLHCHPETSLVASQIWIIDSEGLICGNRTFPEVHDQIVQAMRRFNPICHSSALFRKNVVLEVGGYQHLGRADDYDLWCRLARRGIRFATHSDRLVGYRLHAEQWKSTDFHSTVRATIHIKNRYWRDQMNLGDHIRILLENVLLYLPEAICTKLIRRVLYNKRAYPNIKSIFSAIKQSALTATRFGMR